jgi:tRNA threonylcarbamoyladenosine biosynthesis protein TsaE
MTLLKKLKNKSNDNKIAFDVENILGTKQLAEFVVNNINKGCFIGLYGHLGAGKSEFVRAIAKALGVTVNLRSPTYVLQLSYEIDKKSDSRLSGTIDELCHWDLYRLANAQIPADLEEQFGRDEKLVCIEWPERVPEVEDKLALRIHFGLPIKQGASNGQEVDLNDTGRRIVAFSEVKEDCLYAALKQYE